MNQREAIKRMIRGHAAAEELQRRLRAAEGPNPERAMADALALLDLVESRGAWPGPRDTLAEREVQEVRRRWAKIQKRARTATKEDARAEGARTSSGNARKTRTRAR